MTARNPLLGLVGSYGDSDDESEEEKSTSKVAATTETTTTVDLTTSSVPAGIHPAPIPHCPWSACYDEGSGYTYYWNQETNAVTWDPPQEYLLALKIAQQHMQKSGSSEVSALEWQLYQQALAEKQALAQKKAPTPTTNPPSKSEKSNDEKKGGRDRNAKKRRHSDDDDAVKIELITSYTNSDSESNDETDTSQTKVDTPKQLKPKPEPVKTKTQKKQKIKSVEYGPSLPPSTTYTVPIGPELPPDMVIEEPVKEEEALIVKETIIEEKKLSPKSEQSSEDQDEILLLEKLKDKAKLLEKLGGELPSELHDILGDKPVEDDDGDESKDIEKGEDTKVSDIDDLLQEIEMKELPKVKAKTVSSNSSSVRNSPIFEDRDKNPPLEEINKIKPLFPSAQNIVEEPKAQPSPKENGNVNEIKEEVAIKPQQKPNLYISNDVVEKPKKKLRIDNAVFPERLKSETPAYTTKYSQFIEGFSSERTGLGFSNDDSEETSNKNTISYGNGLSFTKGETLNEEKKDEALDDLMELVEAKLKFLNEQQPSVMSPVQEMLIQMQTLMSAFRYGALTSAYFGRWVSAANDCLTQHEAGAAPPGWTCFFLRSEGRYRYRREADGLEQAEYPAEFHQDMDLCTTPPPLPPQPPENKESAPPPLPPLPLEDPPTPPPPVWNDPPPPGCDDAPMPPLPPQPKKELGDELMSFYNDLAELEKVETPSKGNSPEPPPPPVIVTDRSKDRHDSARSKDKDVDKKERRSKKKSKCNTPEPPPPPVIMTDRIKDSHEKERYRDKDIEKKEGKTKKKSKVKISSSVGLKHKSVSHLVAKWQQVADEINSD